MTSTTDEVQTTKVPQTSLTTIKEPETSSTTESEPQTTENEELVEATTTEKIEPQTTENFEELIEATTTEKLEQTTEIIENTTLENLEEFTVKSTGEPEQSVSEEPFDDLEEFGINQKSFDGDDVTNKRSTTLPPTTTIQSRSMDQKTISSRKAQKAPKVSDTDFDENSGDDSLENIYEYYYEDEPEKVLYTKKAEKSQSRSMTEDAQHTKHEGSRKAEGSNDDFDIIDYFDVAEPDLILWTKTINKKTKEETIEHHIVIEDDEDVGNFEDTTLNSSTDLPLDVTTLKESSEPTEASVQKDNNESTTESISTTSEISTATESSTLATLSGRGFEDETSQTSEMESATFSTLEGRSFDDITTTVSDLESSTFGARSFDESTPDITSTTENILETTAIDENSMKSEITTLTPESTTELDTSTMNIPEELNLMPSTTVKIDISTNLVDFERSENHKESTTEKYEEVFISSGNDFSTFEPQTTENIVTDSTTNLGNSQDSTTTETSVGSKADETTTKLPESTTLNEEIVAHHVTSTQYPFTSSTANPLYWQDPEKKEDIEYYYVYEDYETDENGNPIKKSEDEKNESHDGKESVKQRRDNSFEYYVESISASREQRKVKTDDTDEYYN